MRGSSVWTALAALLWLGCADVGVDRIGPDALAARLQSDDAPRVLDVRTAEEYAAGHVPGALHIPHDQLADRLDALPGDRDTELVVYCERGGRAARAAAVLRDAGYERVVDLTGHMAAWRAADLPVATPGP